MITGFILCLMVLMVDLAVYALVVAYFDGVFDRLDKDLE